MNDRTKKSSNCLKKFNLKLNLFDYSLKCKFVFDFVVVGVAIIYIVLLTTNSNVLIIVFLVVLLMMINSIYGCPLATACKTLCRSQL